MTRSTRPTKLDKLVATYARFGNAIAEIPDGWAQRLYRIAAGLPNKVEELRSVTSSIKPSELASGIEQGLRETPDLIACVDAAWRPAVTAAFYAAISTEFPEFFAKDQKQLEKVLGRGKVASEAEFYLLRHHVEMLEGQPESSSRLTEAYALLAAYELRA